MMAKMRVFMREGYAMLYSGRSLERPKLIGHVYEYETEEENMEYWNSLNSENQEALVDEAMRRKTDLRLLIRERVQK